MKLGQSGEAYDSTQIPEAAAAVASGGSIRRMQGQCARGSETSSQGASAWLWDSLVSTTNFRKHNKLVLSTTRRGRKARITTRGAEQTLQVVRSQAQTPVFSAALTKAQESPSTQHRAPAGARPTTSTSEQPRDRYFIAASKRKMFLPTGKHLSSYKTTSTCPLKCGG